MSDPISPKYVDVQDEASDNSVLLEATREGVAVVLINRPRQRNALNGQTIAALTEAFQTLQGAEGVRLVLLRGAEGVFSAGMDLGWMRHTATLPEEDNRLDALDLAHMLKALHDIPALTVALVEGSAIGAGAGLVAACDMAIAAADAEFQFPEVRLGLSAAVVSPYVIEAVGARAARRLFATGATFDAAAALRLGLISEIVPDGEALNAAADQLATEILTCAPGAMAEAKRAVRDQAGREIDRSLIEDSARRCARASVGPESREGLDAILNGCQPNWAL